QSWTTSIGVGGLDRCNLTAICPVKLSMIDSRCATPYGCWLGHFFCGPNPLLSLKASLSTKPGIMSARLAFSSCMSPSIPHTLKTVFFREKTHIAHIFSSL
ncbi:unnamed protein product, partial [Ectocarpus sp. 12 AP-2014]